MSKKLKQEVGLDTEPNPNYESEYIVEIQRENGHRLRIASMNKEALKDELIDELEVFAMLTGDEDNLVNTNLIINLAARLQQKVLIYRQYFE